MNWVADFFIRNFILLCVCLMMLVNSIQRFKQHQKISLFTILILCCTLVLAVASTLENYAKSLLLPNLTLVFSIIGYSLRPACLYLFILLSGQYKKGKFFFLTFIPLIINTLIYCLGFIPSVQDYAVHFIVSEDHTSMSFYGGFLRYSSFIIAFGYLAWLIYLSVSILKARHLSRAITVLGCSIFIVLAVVIEAFFNDDGEIYLLNTTIAICSIFYYLYLYMDKTETDTLTGLFNRETYYLDVQKMGNSITGVIQFDMNGLKYINDNYGHLEGDKALSTIARLILSSANRKMYIYRLGGDEFILLANDCSEDEIVGTVNAFKKAVADTTYHCSIGYSIKSSKDETIEELINSAEKYMYLDKEIFYKTSNIERRKQ